MVKKLLAAALFHMKSVPQLKSQRCFEMQIMHLKSLKNFKYVMSISFLTVLR